MTDAVEVSGLEKRYPRRAVKAVDGLSFTVGRGEVFGLLGPNGAGKTTTIGMLTTRVRPTGGTATVGGVDVRRDPVRARAQLGVVPQGSNLDRDLTPRQNLQFHAAYHGFPRKWRRTRAAELLDEFGLTEQADIKVDWYSGGMAQRLMIARALMHEPRVLFLDEPTTGLDPQARLFLWDRVRALRERGVTVMLTTHDMTEAAELSDRIGIVDHGRMLALDKPETLTRAVRGHAVLEIRVVPGPGDTADDLFTALTALDGVQRGERLTDGEDRERPGNVMIRLYLSKSTPAALVVPVVTLVESRRAALADVRLGEPSLEDVFIELTGRGLR